MISKGYATNTKQRIGASRCAVAEIPKIRDYILCETNRTILQLVHEAPELDRLYDSNYRS